MLNKGYYLNVLYYSRESAGAGSKGSIPYFPLSLTNKQTNMKKKETTQLERVIHLFVAIIIGMAIIGSFESCSRVSYSYGGSAAGCTAWYPKKYKGDRGKGISPARIRSARMVSF
jgi:hypothetical protein